MDLLSLKINWNKYQFKRESRRDWMDTVFGVFILLVMLLAGFFFSLMVAIPISESLWFTPLALVPLALLVVGWNFLIQVVGCIWYGDILWDHPTWGKKANQNE